MGLFPFGIRVLALLWLFSERFFDCAFESFLVNLNGEVDSGAESAFLLLFGSIGGVLGGFAKGVEVCLVNWSNGGLHRGRILSG